MNYPFRNLIIQLLTGGLSARNVAYQLMVLAENYPKDIFFNNLNNLGTHDTERILTMIGPENNANAIAMMFSLPGVPCIYYGDEAGLTGGKDPDNRKYFPWGNIDGKTFHLYQDWTKKRLSDQTLRHGEFAPFVVDEVLGILRYDADEIYVNLINPTGEDVTLDTADLRFLKPSDFDHQVEEKLHGLNILAKDSLDFKIQR